MVLVEKEVGARTECIGVPGEVLRLIEQVAENICVFLGHMCFMKTD